MAEPFATADDLADRWRSLSPDEETTANTLLGDASRKIRRLAILQHKNLDLLIAAHELDTEDVLMVVVGMVKRAMIAGAEREGVSQETQTAGPFGLTQSFSNPTANLYLAPDDYLMLGLQKRTGRAFAVDLTP